MFSFPLSFAFVTVDSKESAELAIQEVILINFNALHFLDWFYLNRIFSIEQKLNGKTFQESLFSVSFARPRKPFQRNNSYNPSFQRQPSQIGKNPNESPAFDSRSSANSGNIVAGSTSSANYSSNQGFSHSICSYQYFLQMQLYFIFRWNRFGQ